MEYKIVVERPDTSVEGQWPTRNDLHTMAVGDTVFFRMPEDRDPASRADRKWLYDRVKARVLQARSKRVRDPDGSRTIAYFPHMVHFAKVTQWTDDHGGHPGYLLTRVPDRAKGEANVTTVLQTHRVPTPYGSWPVKTLA